MEQEKKIPRRASKKDLADSLLRRVQNGLDKGMTVEQALETLTARQYDFLVDYEEYGARLDNLTMTPQQKQAVKETIKAARPKGLKYNKKYPENKMTLYKELEEFVKSRGGIIAERETQNYRDMDFTIDGTAYKIVLSNPRTKKE